MNGLEARFIERCPRCCPPGSRADILKGRARRAYQCDDADPCVWRKRIEARHDLEDHDMLVMMCDRLQVAQTRLEQELSAVHPGLGVSPAWQSWISQPTKADCVVADVIAVLGEAAVRLTELEEQLKGEGNRILADRAAEGG